MYHLPVTDPKWYQDMKSTRVLSTRRATKKILTSDRKKACALKMKSSIAGLTFFSLLFIVFDISFISEIII